MGQGRFAVILPAAGKSSRFGDPKQKKIYAELDGRAVWLRAVEPFVNRDDVAQIIMAIAAEDREMFDRRYQASVAFMNIKVIDGGAERSDTVARALECVNPECDYIAIHDAARPCLCHELVDAVFDAGRAHGAALLAVRSRRHDQAGRRRSSHDRYRAPRAPLPRPDAPGLSPRSDPHGLRRALARRRAITDDCQLVEALGTHAPSWKARHSISRSRRTPI